MSPRIVQEYSMPLNVSLLRLRSAGKRWYSSPTIPLETGPQGKIFIGRREAGAPV